MPICLATVQCCTCACVCWQSCVCTCACIVQCSILPGGTNLVADLVPGGHFGGGGQIWRDSTHTQGCAQCIQLASPSLLSLICDCEQLAALELERADSAREENSQLRWDLQEAQQALAQRSNTYEVRHILTVRTLGSVMLQCTYIHTSGSVMLQCTYVHTYVHQAVSCYSALTYIRTYIRQCHATVHAINARIDAVMYVYIMWCAMHHCWSLPLASILTAGHCPLLPSSLLVTAPCFHPHCWSLPLASILTAGHCPLLPSSLLVTAPCFHPHCWSLPLASALTTGHCPLLPSSLLVTAPCFHPHCWSLPLASILTAGHCPLLPSSLYYVAGNEDCSC